MLVLMRSANSCNMRCDYCYGDYSSGGEQLDLDDCDLLIARLKPEDAPDGKISFLWHGGEPAMIDPAIFAAMLDRLDRLTEKGFQVDHRIQSNGLGLRGPWLDLLEKHSIHAGISLDGPQPLHDAHRKLADRTGSYARIAENIANLKKAGIGVSLLCTLGLQHVDKAEELVDWLEEMGLSIKFNPLFAKGRCANALPLGEYYKLLREIFALAIKRNIMTSIQPLEWMLKAILFDLPPQECAYSGQCGQNIFSFAKGGNIGVCTRNQNIYGNLEEASLQEIRNSAKWLARRQRIQKLKETCQGCGIYNFCRGGCPEIRGETPVASDCDAIKDFFAWLKGDGLACYLEALVRRKKELSQSLGRLKEMQVRW